MEKSDDLVRLGFIDAIRKAEDAVVAAKAALVDYDSSIENNTYLTLTEAEYQITDRYRDIAHSECGSYMMGAESYTQKFMVDGELYEAMICFEYNRHDKEWYYVDGTEYSYRKL